MNLEVHLHRSALIIHRCFSEDHQQVSNRARKLVLQPAINQLKRAKVPFDTKLLMHVQWRAELGPSFERMEELTKDIHVGPTIQGIHLARTIFVPEKVELVGDTIILAHELVPEDENSEIEISGRYPKSLETSFLIYETCVGAIVAHQPLATVMFSLRSESLPASQFIFTSNGLCSPKP